MPKTRPAGEIVIVVFGESEALDLLTTALGGSVEEKLKVVLGRRRCIIFYVVLSEGETGLYQTVSPPM